MLVGSGFAHPSTSGESPARLLGVGPEPVQAQATPLGGSEVAHPPGGLRRHSVSFAASAGPDLSAPEPEEEDDRGSIVSSLQVVDKTYARLINYVCSQYPESHPLPAPQVPPRCSFEEFFAVADPQGSSRPKLRLYARVEKLVSQTQDSAAKLARKSRLLHRVFPLKCRSFSVADGPDYTTPRWLNPDFIGSQETRRLQKLVLVLFPLRIWRRWGSVLARS